jgi:hypothetical protein
MSYAKGKNDIDFDEGMEPPLESAIKTKWFEQKNVFNII